MTSVKYVKIAKETLWQAQQDNRQVLAVLQPKYYSLAALLLLIGN